MKKRLSLITICIVVLALFLGANTIGCGSSNNAVALPDEGDDVVDDNTPNDDPAASETPYDQYYWVSKEGSDDNPGTQEEPFLTLFKAALEAYRTPKDIYVFPGTYKETSLLISPNVSIYGLGSRTIDPVKYRPVIDMRNCGRNYCSIFLVGASSGYNGGSDITIDGLKIYAETIGISAYETALTLTNSEIIVSDNGSDHSTGVSVDSTSDTANIVIRNNTIKTEDSTIPNSRTTGLSIFSNGAIAVDILDNIISTGETEDYTMAVSISNFGSNEQNILIRGNTISSSDAGRMSGGIFSIYTHTLRIEQNTISVGNVQDLPTVNEFTTGVYVYSDPAMLRTNATILNNAIYGGSGGNHAKGIYLDRNVDALILFNTIDAGSSTSTDATGIYTFEGVSSRIHNNILCAGTNNQSYGIFELRGTMMELSHNLFCQDLDTFYETHAENALPQSYTDVAIINALDVEFANNIAGDPNFVDFAGHDYHTVFPSNAVDTGRSVTGITYDLDGNARLRGQAPDIGAYELR